MPDTPSIVIQKSMDYRGQPEVWTNKYHFSGTTPGSAAAWKALADAIILQEQKHLPFKVSFVGALGYEAGNEHSVYQVDYRVAPNTVLRGSTNISANSDPQTEAGDVAYWVRWRTPDRNSRGKPVYLRKYFHAAVIGNSADAIFPTQKSRALDYANAMMDGSLPGGVKICGPQGAVASAPTVSDWLTTRTLKRRGRRP